MTGRIIFPPVSFDCILGVTEEERRKRQQIKVQLEFIFDPSLPARSDNVKDTVDYAEVFLILGSVVRRSSFHLLEALAREIVSVLLKKHPLVQSITVRVSKNAFKVRGLPLVTFEWTESRRGLKS